MVNVHSWLFDPVGAVVPMVTRSSRMFLSTGLSLKLRQERREAISCTRRPASSWPCVIQSLSIRKDENCSGSKVVTRTAPTGHTATQCPQLIDFFPVTQALPSTMESVSYGQTFTHRPQPVHFSKSIIVFTMRSIISSKRMVDRDTYLDKTLLLT